MKELLEFNQTYRMAVASSAAIVSVFVEQHLSRVFESRSLVLLGMMLIVAVLVAAVSAFLEALVHRSRRLRRMIVGEGFIEGYWFDMSGAGQGAGPHHAVLIRIGHAPDGYEVSGVTYSLSGERVATFRAVTSVYKDAKLFCEYESNTTYGPLEKGVMQLQFDSPPSSYSGFYFDYAGTISGKVHGDRVGPESLATFNGFASAEDKKAFILAELGKRGASR